MNFNCLVLSYSFLFAIEFDNHKKSHRKLHLNTFLRLLLNLLLAVLSITSLPVYCIICIQNSGENWCLKFTRISILKTLLNIFLILVELLQPQTNINLMQTNNKFIILNFILRHVIILKTFHKYFSSFTLFVSTFE